jgi:membrane protease YdiL (CAAX protease family)
MKTKMRTKTSLIVFIIVTLASGWLGVLLDLVIKNNEQENSLGMLLWLVLPLLASIILRWINRDGKGMGIRPNFNRNLKWYFVALIVYPLITMITVGLGVLWGSTNIKLELNIVLPLIGAALVTSFIKNIFEEFAWRGYLTPKLIELKINDWLIYMISGLVWALWHAPYYFFFLPNHYFETLSRMDTLLIGCVLMVIWNVMFVEIYRITNSVWPTVLMHAVEDAVPTLLTTGGFIIFTKYDWWLNPITGMVATLIILTIGLMLRRVRMKLVS